MTLDKDKPVHVSTVGTKNSEGEGMQLLYADKAKRKNPTLTGCCETGK